MAQLANVQGVIESLPSIPKLQNYQKKITKSCKIKCQSKNIEECGYKVQCITTRRSLVGFGSIALLAQFGVKTCLAAEEGNNGWWRDGLLPGLEPIHNEIANKETGTRSFLKVGLYIVNIGVQGSEYRVKKYAFDLMALGDLIGKDAWNYFRKYLKLKATVMYYDFDKLISAASLDDKLPLTTLANRLFDSFEKLLDAVKQKDLPLTEACYSNTTIILQEIMDRKA